MDVLTLCSAMMVEWWTSKQDMVKKDDTDVEDSSGYEKSGVQRSSLGWKDHISVELHAGFECHSSPIRDGQSTRTKNSRGPRFS
jgi:hypothetical protein